MNEENQINGVALPRWGLLDKQVNAYKKFLYHPEVMYVPYRID
jgi:hypothetical protein